MSHYVDPDDPNKSFTTRVRNGDLTTFYETKETTHSVTTPAVNIDDVEIETFMTTITRKIINIQTS
jgi:hypothetical protein